ncbi:MAG: UvrD-helicase domain-containing protein, partial [Bacteroidota bacterium]
LEGGTAQIIPEYEKEDVIASVASSLLAGMREDELDGMSETLRQLAGGKSKTNPTASLVAAAKSLHDLYMAQTNGDAWGNYLKIWDGEPLWLQKVEHTKLMADLDKLVARAESQMDKAPSGILNARKHATEHRHIQALSELVEHFETGLPGIALGTYLEGFEFGHAKGGKKRRAFASDDDAKLIGNIMQRLAGNAVRERLVQTQAAHRCLKDYERSYDDLARRRGLLTYADYVRLLNERLTIGTEERRDLTAIHYRMDAAVRHLLLDEFQDTSTQQFEALNPHLSEILAKTDTDQSLFVVGDPKQSLYEWRAGNRRLLDTMERRLRAINAPLEAQGKPGRSEILPLDETRRCSGPVLSLTNAVLDKLSDRDLGTDFPGSAREAWNANYTTQRAYVDPDKPGSAKKGESLWVRLPRQKGNSKAPSVMAQARWIAWHLRQHAGALDEKGRL